MYEIFTHKFSPLGIIFLNWFEKSKYYDALRAWKMMKAIFPNSLESFEAQREIVNIYWTMNTTFEIFN